MPIKITYSGTLDKLKEATQQANEILDSSDFLEIIKSRTSPFADSKPKDLSPGKVAEKFKVSTLKLKLREYRTRPSVGGKFNTGYPRSIWANTRAVPLRSSCSLASMLVHECVHALSYNVKGMDFSHDDDDPKDNQDTAPYWIQKRVKKRFCKALTEEELNEPIIVELEEQEEGIIEDPYVNDEE